VAGYIHWTILKLMGLRLLRSIYNEHILEKIINVNGTSVMWDLPVITGRTILAKRTGTVLHDKKEKTCLVIDVAISDDTNFNTKESEKLSTYKDLEINRMRKVRTKIIPVGALGTIKKGLDQNLKLLPGHPSDIKLQITLMSTVHIIRRVLRKIALTSC
jgi:hypothetical protein